MLDIEIETHSDSGTSISKKLLQSLPQERPRDELRGTTTVRIEGNIPERLDSHYDGGNGSEFVVAEQKCCICIPIHTGIVLIGLFFIYSGVRGVLDFLDLGANPHSKFLRQALSVIVSALVIAPIILAGIYFLQYLIKDTRATRKNLSVGCACVILSQIFEVISGIFSYLFYEHSTFKDLLVDFFIVPIVYISVYFYFMGVCKRYADRYPQQSQ